MTHSSLPIMASLANSPVSFSCRISYPYTPQFKAFTVSYFHEDLHGRRSPEKPTNCHPGLGIENQTYALNCLVTLVPLDTSATGTYYCSVNRPHPVATGSGTFILVRGEASSVALPGAKDPEISTSSLGLRIRNREWGQVRWLTSVIPALREAETSKLPEVRSLRPAWPTW